MALAGASPSGVARLPADVGDLDWDWNASEQLSKNLGGESRKIDTTVDMGAYEGPFSGSEW